MQIVMWVRVPKAYPRPAFACCSLYNKQGAVDICYFVSPVRSRPMEQSIVAQLVEQFVLFAQHILTIALHIN